MIKKVLLQIFLLAGLAAFSQPGQLSISRIEQMPDLPAPLEIRDWKAVATAYDNFVFDLTKTGQYLPLGRLGNQGQFNYSDNIPLFLDTYVGPSAHLNQAEAINIMPAIVGASLVGVDKSSQNGENWVLKSRDFFNLKNGQNVYLNNYITTSGGDWWYDLMPNVYFYQLRSLYPGTVPEFENQFITVADRWLWAVWQLGGSATPWTVPYMNYRAFNLATGQPLTTGVPEPESAGSIAWLLYNAYSETGARKYMEGARLALDFLAGWENNPSYELQLPYGTLAAARMNAVEGTSYPVQKFLDWCFDRGALRGWGAIKGNWGGYDISGLIGEANDGGNDYAFVMNGFQQAAALAPLPKYDKRYAKAIAKWMLNLTNASRLFYWNALPQANQDSYNWASANDPDACIPYEAMKENFGGKKPFATGDAIRGGWAATNLSLYSGSSVGYLAAVVSQTNVPEILRIDLNRTDFYGDNNLIGYLFFNPLQDARTVNFELPEGTFGMYEAITEEISSSSFTGQAQFTIPAGEARLVRFYPWGTVPEAREGRLYAGDAVLDYHYQYDFSEHLRVKALSVSQNPLLVSSEFTAYCEAENMAPGDEVTYTWYLDDDLLQTQGTSQQALVAPATPGSHVLKCIIASGGQTAQDTLHLHVVDRIPVPPVVHGISMETLYTAVNGNNLFTALAEPAPGEILEYSWSVSFGELQQSNANPAAWNAPDSPGCGTVSVTVTNQDQLSTTVTAALLVKDTTMDMRQPLIWYPFDHDNKNMASDRFHATVSGVVKTEDPRGMASAAYRFTKGSDIIYTENHADLNFTDAVSMSCWVKVEQLGSERFIVSHGSWQQRYKLSVTPEGYLRWTVKSSTGTADLDGSAPIELNRYYHVAVLYTGYSLEMYVDGTLDAFKPFSGSIQVSTKPLTIGRMDNTETLYSLRGSVDEFRLWDREIPIPQIEKLKDEWATPYGIEENELITGLWPNPATDEIFVKFKKDERIHGISLISLDGREIKRLKTDRSTDHIQLSVRELPAGIYFLKITISSGQVISRKVMVM